MYNLVSVLRGVIIRGDLNLYVDNLILMLAGVWTDVI